MLHLIAANLMRAPARCLLAIASFAAAAALFVLLMGIARAFATGIPGEPYLHVSTARSYNVGFLPPSAVETLRQTPGVEVLTPLYNLPLYYQQPSNLFIAVAVSPEDYLAMFDLGLSAAAKSCFLETRNGAIATPSLAARYNWQAGDQVPLISPHDLTRTGDNHWPFVFCGTFEPLKEVAFAFHANFDYVDEYHIAPVRKYGQFIVEVAHPAVLRQTALAIDALFESERHATESIPLDAQQRGTPVCWPMASAAKWRSPSPPSSSPWLLPRSAPPASPCASAAPSSRSCVPLDSARAPRWCWQRASSPRSRSPARRSGLPRCCCSRTQWSKR